MHLIIVTVKLVHSGTREIFNAIKLFVCLCFFSLTRYFLVQLIVFDDLSVPTHKTKYMANYVAQMEDTKKVLLVNGGPIDEKLKLATQNLHYVNVLPSIVSHSYHSLYVCFTEFIEMKPSICAYLFSCCTQCNLLDKRMRNFFITLKAF